MIETYKLTPYFQYGTYSTGGIEKEGDEYAVRFLLLFESLCDISLEGLEFKWRLMNKKDFRIGGSRTINIGINPETGGTDQPLIAFKFKAWAKKDQVIHIRLNVNGRTMDFYLPVVDIIRLQADIEILADEYEFTDLEDDPDPIPYDDHADFIQPDEDEDEDTEKERSLVGKIWDLVWDWIKEKKVTLIVILVIFLAGVYLGYRLF